MNIVDLMAAQNDEPVEGESFDEMMARYDDLPVESIRSKILKMQSYLSTLPQAEVPVKQYIVGGILYREITIPKGVYCVGSVYKEPHIHFVIRGDMTVLTDEGLKRVTGAQSFVSPAGVKRAGYAHEETVWAAVFRTDETDPEKAFQGFTVEEGLI
jgi:hypothetical protein